jgi:hypothetical protein
MKILIMIILLLSSLFLFAGSKDSLKVMKSDVEAFRTNDRINVDGILDDPAWNNSIWFSAFYQRDPDEGASPTEKTEYKVAYDDEAIYFAIRLYDSQPDSIVTRLARRDVFVNADRVFVYLDPYKDRRSGYFFGISAAGNLYDGVFYNDDWNDNSWDGVWEGKTKIDNKGWTAEFKIPFSQLKFHNTEDNIWGINIKREISRKNEVIYQVFVPKKESGFVSHFANLHGLKNLKTPGRLEILPYVTGKAEYTHPDAGNPFNDGSNYTPGIGVDIRTGIGTNLTLNATINPDFGQVEIDPAVINLSDVETFFSEKRPFFVEGASIFRFGQGGARNYWNFNWSNPTHFYSRRIGRVPQGQVESDYDFISSPEGTRILGAAKLTGSLGNNWNMGVIQSVTKREFAETEYNNGVGLRKDRFEVEPLSYYGIFRGQKEFEQGHYGLGFISTVTARSFENDNTRKYINNNAVTGGIDGWIFLDSSKTWVLAGWGGFSRIEGTPHRLISVQRNSQHYFQRPDAYHVNVDSSATSLTGYAARIVLNKQKGNFFFNSAFGVIDPKYDINDVGLLFRTDQINSHVGAGYFWSEPTNAYRWLELGGASYVSFDFGGNSTGKGIFHFGSIQLLNYYNANWNLGYSFEGFNNRRTRGGPLTKEPAGVNGSLWINSDSRKNIVIGFGNYAEIYGESKSYGTDFEIEYRPISNLSLSFNPGYTRNSDFAQWVTSFADPSAVETYGRRYVFAELSQTTISAGIRLNWTLNPNLSLQLFMQPLISAGEYNNFKQLAAASTYDFKNLTASEIVEEGNDIKITPAGSTRSISINNPDFNFVSLRGNAVLRWEYLPGSVLFFVWTQNRSDFERSGDFMFKRSFDKILDAKADNIFMIKMTYYLNM